MRNLRKLTALVIAIAIVLTSMTVAFAATPVNADQAATLKDLGLYAGVDANDVTVGLDSALTTQDSLIFLAKLFGYFDAANKLTDAEVTAALAKFADAKDIAGYAKKVVAYSAINSILNGSTKDGKFYVQPKATVTDARFATFMLKEMGYEVPDFTESVAQISEVKGSKISDAAIGDLTRDDAVGMMYGVLPAEKKDATTVIAGIVGDNADLKAIAVEAGLIDATPAIDSVTVTGVKSVTVKFKAAVDTTKAVLKVKKGAAIYGSTVAWNDKKDTATLTTIVNLPAADYTVEVTGLTTVALTKAFTVAAQAASKIEVSSTTVPLSDSAPISFKVLNQYGEDMKVVGNAVVVSAYNTTQKADVTLTGSLTESKFTVPANFKTAGTTKLNDVIRVTIAYAGLTAQANVTVIDPAANSSIAFGEVAPKTGSTRITVGDTGLTVPYTLYDQYSVATKLSLHSANQDLAADSETINGVQFISSNPAVVDVDTFAVDADGKLTFTAGATAGTATITAVINATGSIAQFVVTVNGTAKVDSLAIAAPSALVAAGETVKLDVTAADQFGAAIAAKDIKNVSVTSSNTGVVANGSTITAGKLNVVTIAAGTTTLTAKNEDSKVVGTVTIVVEAAADIMQVKSVSFPAKFEVGAAKTMTTSDFEAIDQYGRTISSGVTFTVAEKTVADTQFNVSGAAITAANAGSSVMTLTATYNAKSVTYDFTLTAVASSDITTYAITAVPTMYNGAAHAKALELVGKTAAGETVVLKANKVVSATSSDISKATVSVSGGVATVTGKTDAEGNVVVSLWDASAKLAETTITFSKVAPVATTVAFDSSVETALVATVDLSNNIVVKDQYGVVIPDVGFWTTSDATKATVLNGIVTMGTASTGDTVTIGYVSSNGLVVTTVLTK